MQRVCYAWNTYTCRVLPNIDDCGHKVRLNFIFLVSKHSKFGECSPCPNIYECFITCHELFSNSEYLAYTLCVGIWTQVKEYEYLY